MPDVRDVFAAVVLVASMDYVIALGVSVLLFGYLVYGLLRPDRF